MLGRGEWAASGADRLAGRQSAPLLSRSLSFSIALSLSLSLSLPLSFTSGVRFW